MNLGKLNMGRMKPTPRPANTALRPRATAPARPGTQVGPKRPVATGSQVGPKRQVPVAAVAPADARRQQAARAAAAPAPAARRPAPAAVATAAQRYTGAFSGALNNLDEQEQRVHDVASRRRADAEKYAAYVMGQQGTVAAAAATADQQAFDNIRNVQASTQYGLMEIQGNLSKQREAQGLGGPVPAQQLAGVVGDATRAQQLLGAAGTQQAVVGNANKGRAQFLAAAAQANMLAHQRAISGDEFEQSSAIGREKTGVLTTKTQETLASKRAAQAAAADVASAEIAAQSDAADRASRESIASSRNATSAEIANARISSSEQEGRKGRQARLKQARIGAASRATAASKTSAKASAADKRRATEDGVKVRTAGADARTLINSQIPVRDPKTGKPTGKTRKPTEAEVRAKMRDRYDDVDIANAAMDIAILGEVGAVNRGRLERRGIPVPKPTKKRRSHGGAGGVAGAVVRDTSGGPNLLGLAGQASNVSRP